MSTQEKRPIIFMIIDIIVFCTYHISILHIHDQKSFSSTEELSFWAAAIIALIPITIVCRIVLYVVYSILNTVITKEKEEKFLTDEFGQLIKLKASPIFSNTFMVGFLLSMGLLVVGVPISTTFKVLLFSVYLSFIVHNLSKFHYTRKGVHYERM